MVSKELVSERATLSITGRISKVEVFEQWRRHKIDGVEVLPGLSAGHFEGSFCPSLALGGVFGRWWVVEQCPGVGLLVLFLVGANASFHNELLTLGLLSYFQCLIDEFLILIIKIFIFALNAVLKN